MNIKQSSPREEHYNLLKEVYPWDWGTKDKFIWKHMQDPFCNNDVYEAYDNNELIGILVARKYPFLVKGEKMNFLCLMDFAVRKEYSNKGIGKLIQDSIKIDSSIDAEVGTAGFETYKRYYSRVPYYTIIRETTANAYTPVEYCKITDLDIISSKLNENSNPFFVERTPAYIEWIKRCPDFQEVIFISDEDGNIAGLGIKKDIVQVIELSTMTEKFLNWSVAAASNFRNMVKFDVPEFIDIKDLDINLVSSKDLYLVFNPLTSSAINLLNEKDNKWVPKVDRK